MSSTGRPLVAGPLSTDDPFRGDDSSGQGSGQKPGPGSRPKRTLIESACAACRRRKSKCDGARPQCSRCQTLRTDCIYEAEEGESRWSALRRRSQALEQERDELREVLSWLIVRPEHEALEVFHRIRSTGGYEELLAMARQAREAGAGLTSQIAQSSAEQRLPPIRTLVDVPGASQMQPRPGLPPSNPSTGSMESYSSTYSAMDPPPHQPPST